MKITALTSLCVDIYPELNEVYVGGNSLNFATQCKLSGINDVSIIGAVGNDSFGNLIKAHLDKLQINSSKLYRLKEQTASNKIFIDDNGDRYFKPDSWNGGAFDAFRLSEHDWLSLSDSTIIAMPGGDPNLKALLKRRQENQIVIIDFLDYLGIEFIREHIDHIDIVFLSGKEEQFDALQKLSTEKGKMIVATLGAKGSIAFYDNITYVQDAIETDTIIDTTGCGDAFQAAFVIEWHKNRNIKEALYQGALAAKNVLGFVGGVE
ncbi:PfkB family carbohydrate kinase [Winogradskyella sp. A2]|uniref:PfkB family carbohydrate kinase n=1 Tax=Winogradskyella sp. A2 TaxID=3366944 RepID=UPI00398C5179